MRSLPKNFIRARQGAIFIAILVVPMVWQLPKAKGQKTSFKTDQAALTANLTRFASPGLPGQISSFNDRSFVVVAGRNGNSLVSVIAAGEFGGEKKGRMVAFGHDGYLDTNAFAEADTGKLVLRLARWAAHVSIAEPSPKPTEKLRLALVNHPNLAPFFTKAGWEVSNLIGDWSETLGNQELLILTAGDIRTKQQSESVRKHLASGRGVLFGITGWGWEQISGGKSLMQDFPLTPVLAEAGLAVTNATAEPTDGKFMAASDPDQLALLNAGVAFETLKSASDRKQVLNQAELEQIGASLLIALRAVPNSDTTFRPRLIDHLARHTRRIISKEHPVKRVDILDRIAIQMDYEMDAILPAAAVKANPSAADFPGSVPADAPRIQKTIVFERDSRGKLGTGLYAPAGSVVGIKIKPEGLEIPTEIRVRIGNHSDQLWHLDQWERHPEISRAWRLKQGVQADQNQFASAFGGLIMIEIETPLADRLELQITGAVAAPHFVMNKTDLSEWEKLRHAPAPWAQLQSRHVGLDLPSESVRGIKDPRPLLRLWDQIMETQDQLGPLNREYKPTQWVVPDRQISAGYMHSGNPIMTFMDVVPIFSNDTKLMTTEPGGITWGILHEIGHNRQRSEWTPSGLGEVTNNLFALYVYEKMVGKPSAGHPGLLVGDKRRKALAEYQRTGPNFEKFQNDPFLALAFFMEIQESFGWEPFVRYFAAAQVQPFESRPRNDAQRWAGWLTGLSQETRRNLGPYFQMWGIPVSKKALESVGHLPEWSPKSGAVSE